MIQVLGLAVVFGLQIPVIAAVDLADGFANPPEEASPWCYWYWISDNVSREGITRDLEAMKQVGIKEALIGNIFQQNVPAGEVKVLSDEWWEMTRHAMAEGGRLGVNVGLFNCPGWSQSGGPWVGPEQAMRFLKSSEVRVSGPGRVSMILEKPAVDFQQVSVLAFPVPELENKSFAARVICQPEAKNPENLIDGRNESAAVFRLTDPRQKAEVVIGLSLDKAMPVRALEMVGGETPFAADCEIAVQDADGKWKVLKRFEFNRSNPKPNVGAVRPGPVAVSFAVVEGREFRLRLTRNRSQTPDIELAEVRLSGAARLERYVEKQLGQMHPTPTPDWGSYVWPQPAEPGVAGVDPAEVRDLTGLVGEDGRLEWDVPGGDWIILRTGMTPTGVTNDPASPEGSGLELDKMNRELAQWHFEQFAGKLLETLGPDAKRAFRRLVADSYETGAQNWTDGFEKDFRETYGYDPVRWLPVLTGRIVGSADQSERFLWDLRRLVADRVATEYVGGLRDASEEHGLELWLENYGHWGFPSEFLKYGGASHRIAGEFWTRGALGTTETRAASSAANIYGKRIVSAESYTGAEHFVLAPQDIKARGDWSYCQGINHVVLHLYIHQSDERKPGINAGFGTEFNRNNTWFGDSKAWMDYQSRSCWLLQQGHRVADVAYFIGEDAPKMTGVRDPELPEGRDYDYVNAEVIHERMSVENGLIRVKDGPDYRVLVLPPSQTMRPELLAKIDELVRAGATVLGLRPLRSPSLQGFPEADEAVRETAAGLWGNATGDGERAVGKGRVIWGRPLEQVFAADKFPPDIEFHGASGGDGYLFTHRRTPDAEIYFVSNQKDTSRDVNAVFRVTGRQPELWNAVTGERRDLTEWTIEGDRTVIPLHFEPAQSWFVIFREAGEPGGGKNFPELSPVSLLDGPWKVVFDPKLGGPGEVDFASLVDWSEHDDAGVRFYSGKAVYRQIFEAPAMESGPVYLDLGKVEDVAVVRLNGKELGTMWTAPFRIDVSKALHAGSNELEIEVVNVWNNRLVGDRGRPDGERISHVAFERVREDTPLLSSGLLGPVALKRERGD